MKSGTSSSARLRRFSLTSSPRLRTQTPQLTQGIGMLEDVLLVLESCQKPTCANARVVSGLVCSVDFRDVEGLSFCGRRSAQCCGWPKSMALVSETCCRRHRVQQNESKSYCVFAASQSSYLLLIGAYTLLFRLFAKATMLSFWAPSAVATSVPPLQDVAD